MRRILATASFIILSVALTAIALAWETERARKAPEPEKVYQKSEVTQPAVIKSRPEAAGDIIGCPEKGSVRVRLVLHKSGKVTEVKLLRGLGKQCSFERNALEAAGGVEFVPALKDGGAVSQYLTLEYVYGERIR